MQKSKAIYLAISPYFFNNTDFHKTSIDKLHNARYCYNISIYLSNI